MKNLYILISLSVFYSFCAQGQESKILKITYDTHIPLSKKADFETVLYADDSHSQFVHNQKANIINTEEGYKIKLPTDFFLSNYDFLTQEVHDNRVMDKVVLSSSWKNDLVWEITDEEKEIAGYKVRKATTTSYGDKNSLLYTGKATAWFTTEIPLPTGPGRYYGLPGLIVRLYYDATREGYTLKKVEYLSKDSYTFAPLFYENEISQEDMIYNAFRSSKVKEIIKANKRKNK